MSAGNLVQIIGTPGNSPALKYEMQLAEATSNAGPRAALSEERIDLCFSILDDLIPKLGVFQRVMKLIKKELHNAVFSDEYTAGGSRKKKKGCDQAPMLVPYFSIAKRCMEEKDKEVSKLKKQVHMLKEQLYTCEADLEKASSAIEGFKYDIKQCEAQITGLTSDLQTTVNEKKHLQQLATELQGQQDVISAKMEEKILRLKNTIASHDITINELRSYKTTYEKLQKKFSASKAEDLLTSGTKLTTNKGSLEHEISVAKSLENQILQMQNKQIEQYEEFLDTLTNRKEDRSKAKIQRERFRVTMDEIDKELLMLRSQQKALSTRLDQLSSLDPAHPHKAIIAANHPSCPLVTQEQPLNKYAAMLHFSSDNGASYYPNKEAEDCLSCGEKVVICPHWSSSELVIQLPLNSTHIRLTRPLLHSHAPPTSSIAVKMNSVADEKASHRVMQRQVSESILDPDINKIWTDFTKRFSVERTVPQHVSKGFLLKIMSAFYSKQLALDETLPADDSLQQLPPPLLSLFYKFVIERYYLKHVAILVIHDLLTALLEHYRENIYLLVFSHVLSGTLDSVVFRFQLLYADLVGVVSWSASEQFKEWAHVVYPFLEDDELEEMLMDFIGHSSNLTDHQTVMEYVTWLLMKYRDPFLRQAESQLSDQNTIHMGSMNETEFAEACLLLCPQADALAMRLYHQSLADLTEHHSERRVPTRQLAYILSYVNLLSTHQSIVANLSMVCGVDRRPISLDNHCEHPTLSSIRDLNK